MITIRARRMDNSLEHFDWIPPQLVKVLEDILADAPTQPVTLPQTTDIPDSL